MSTTEIADGDAVSSGYWGAGKSRSARELAASVSAVRAKSSIARSRAEAAKPSRKSRKMRAQPMAPTPERLAKGDVVKTTGGAMVAQSGLDILRRVFDPPHRVKAQGILQRLNHRMALAEDPGMNDHMYETGKHYEGLVERAGLSGIAAQNLLGMGGSGDPAYMMPISEAARSARVKLRKAWDILPDEAVKALHGMLIDGRDAESVGRELSMYTQTKECRVAGITLLRIALSMLVAARWA